MRPSAVLYASVWARERHESVFMCIVYNPTIVYRNVFWVLKRIGSGLLLTAHTLSITQHGACLPLITA